jgi:hypothetical protein
VKSFGLSQLLRLTGVPVKLNTRRSNQARQMFFPAYVSTQKEKTQSISAQVGVNASFLVSDLGTIKVSRVVLGKTTRAIARK